MICQIRTDRPGTNSTACLKTNDSPTGGCRSFCLSRLLPRRSGGTVEVNSVEEQFSYSQVDITEGFGDNERLGPEDWISTSPLNSGMDDPESMGLPRLGADPNEVYRVASELSLLRESIPIPTDGVYCPICHIANVDLGKLRTPCPKCGRDLLKFGWD